MVQRNVNCLSEYSLLVSNTVHGSAKCHNCLSEYSLLVSNTVHVSTKCHNYLSEYPLLVSNTVHGSAKCHNCLSEYLLWNIDVTTVYVQNSKAKWHKCLSECLLWLTGMSFSTACTPKQSTFTECANGTWKGTTDQRKLYVIQTTTNLGISEQLLVRLTK